MTPNALTTYFVMSPGEAHSLQQFVEQASQESTIATAQLTASTLLLSPDLSHMLFSGQEDTDWPLPSREISWKEKRPDEVARSLATQTTGLASVRMLNVVPQHSEVPLHISRFNLGEQAIDASIAALRFDTCFAAVAPSGPNAASSLSNPDTLDIAVPEWVPVHDPRAKVAIDALNKVVSFGLVKHGRMVLPVTDGLRTFKR